MRYLKNISITIIIVMIFSGISPYVLNIAINKRVYNESEDTGDNIDQIGDYMELLDLIQNSENSEENYKDEGLLFEGLGDDYGLEENLDHYVNTSFDGTYYITKEYTKHQFNETLSFNFENLGKPAQITDIIEMNLNKEYISSFYIISEEQIKSEISEAIEKTITSLLKLAKIYNFDISSGKIEQAITYLQDKVNSRDYLVRIKWFFTTGLTFETYGIYDSTKARYILDPVLTSFPKSYVSEETIITKYSNNTIQNGVSGSIYQVIILYAYILWVRVEFCRVHHYFNYRYKTTPVANGLIDMYFEWDWTGITTLSNALLWLDFLFVAPKYSVPSIKFYYDGSLQSTQSSGLFQGTSHSGSRSYSIAVACGTNYQIKYSYATFQFSFGYQYLWQGGLWDYYGWTGYALSVTGVSPLQFKSIYTSVTDVILGVDFSITIKLKNPNEYNIKFTLSVDQTSLTNGTHQFLEFTETSKEFYTEILGANQEKDYIFEFRPINGGEPLMVTFECSAKIYEEYYTTSSNSLIKIGPSEFEPNRPSSGYIEIDIVDEVPGFSITRNNINIQTTHNGFFEPGDDITVNIINLRNIGKIPAENVTFELYFEGSSVPATSIFIAGPIIASEWFDVTLPSFILQNFGILPAVRKFYLTVSYSYFGRTTPQIVNIFEQDPIPITWDLVAPTIDFSILDSAIYGVCTYDAFLNVDYDGNRLESFSYDIDTYFRRCELDPIDPTLTNIMELYKYMKIQTALQQIELIEELFYGLQSTEGLKASILVWLVDILGSEIYKAIGSVKSVKEEAFVSDIKHEENVLYDPNDPNDNSRQKLAFYGLDKKPLLSGAPGNALCWLIHSHLCQAFTRALYLFEIEIEMVDIYGNTKKIIVNTDNYNDGKIETGNVFGIEQLNLVEILLNLKSSFLCKAGSYLVFAVIYYITSAILSFFLIPAAGIFAKAATACLVNGIGCLILAELCLFLSFIFLGFDPPLNDETNGISSFNFANDSASGVGNNFIESANKVYSSGKNLTQGVLNQSNAMASGENITNNLADEFDSFESTMNEYTNTLNEFNQEINEIDMSYTETEEFESDFNDTIQIINQTGIASSPVRAMCDDLGLDGVFLNSLEQPGLIRGDPTPLKNVSIITSYALEDCKNMTNSIVTLESVIEGESEDYISDNEDLQVTNINIQDLDLLENYRITLDDAIDQENYEEALEICTLIELKVDEIIDQTHNTTVLWYKNLASALKNQILSMNDFVPSLYSDKIGYNIGENVKISTEIKNIAYTNDSYSIEVLESPKFSDLNYEGNIDADSKQKAILAVQEFSIPYDWHIATGIYNISLLITSSKFGKTRTITLSFEILPYHNTTMIQQISYIALQPGQSDLLSHTIENYGNCKEYYIIEFDGIDETWFSLPSEYLILDSGEIVEYSINISIPFSNLIPPDIHILNTNFSTYELFTFTYELEILPYYEIEAEYTELDKDLIDPGEYATSYVYIKNLGNTPITIYIIPINIDKPEWFLIPNPVLLDVNESRNITCLFSPERIYSTSSGLYTINLFLSLVEDPELTMIFEDDIIINEFFESQIIVQPINVSAEIGDIVEYIFDITNLGNTRALYCLETFEWNTSIVNNWTIIEQPIITLNPGETGEIILKVSVPYFWENMDPINSICLVYLKRINESVTNIYELVLMIDSTPPAMIYFIINKLSILYNEIDNLIDSCFKYSLLKLIKMANCSLKLALYYYNEENFKITVILEILSREELIFSDYIVEFADLFNIISDATANYLKDQFLELQDYISILIGTTINVALNSKLGTDISNIDLMHTELYRIINSYDLCWLVNLKLRLSLNCIKHKFSVLYLFAVLNKEKSMKNLVKCLIHQYDVLLHHLAVYKRFNWIPEDCYTDLILQISNIKEELNQLI